MKILSKKTEYAEARDNFLAFYNEKIKPLSHWTKRMEELNEQLENDYNSVSSAEILLENKASVGTIEISINDRFMLESLAENLERLQKKQSDAARNSDKTNTGRKKINNPKPNTIYQRERRARKKTDESQKA